jgi:hypothetical protein
MYAALFGELALHPRPDAAGEPSEDAYSLFRARSAAMGWLTPAVAGAPGGIWGMHEAEAGPAPRSEPAPVASFQVGLTGPAAAGTLPVQPFLACAGAVVARLGTLRLQAVQVLLPERDAPGRGVLASRSGLRVAWPLLDSRNWFADCDPRRRASVRVTLDGPDPSIRAAAPAILQRIREIRQDVFLCESLSLADDDHLVLPPTPLDEGPPPEIPHHRVTFHGTLAEWSLDAVGWLAAFLADVSSRQRVRTRLVLAVGLSGSSLPGLRPV